MITLSANAGTAVLVAKGTLILAVGWSAATMLRRAGAHARHLVWLSAIVGVLLLPAVARVAPLRVAVLPTDTPRLRVPAQAAASPSTATLPTELPTVSANITTESAPRVVSRFDVSLESVLLTLWLVVAGALALRFLLGAAVVTRMLRRTTAVESPEWLQSLADAAERIGVDAPRLVTSDEVDVAFACGALVPTIVLPACADEWPIDRRRAVLLHELAHLRRRDLVAHAISRLVCAVYWFHPLVWVAARRLRAESEQACDELVLESGVRASDYAQHLLEMVIALDPRHAAPAAALPIVRPKEFEGRLLAILERASRRTTVGRTRLGLLVALVTLSSVSIAAVAPVARDRSATTPSVAAAQPSNQTTARATPAPSANVHRPTARRAYRALPGTTVDWLLRFGTAGVVDPMLMLLRDADSMHLTGLQADSIATLNRAYMIGLSGIWSPVARYYRTHAPDAVDAAVADRFADAPRATADLLASFAPHVLGLLTPEQRRALSPRVAAYLDRDSIAAIPDRVGPLEMGVFDPLSLFGGGRGGRGRVGGPGSGFGPGARGRVGGGGQ